MKVNSSYSEDKKIIELNDINNEIKYSSSCVNSNIFLNCITSSGNSTVQLKRANAITGLDQIVNHLPGKFLCKIEYKLLSDLSNFSAENYVYCGMVAGFHKSNIGMVISDGGRLHLIKGRSYDLIRGLRQKIKRGYDYYSAPIINFRLDINFSSIYVNENGILTGEEKYTGKTYSIEINPESSQEDIEGQYASITFLDYIKDESDNLVFDTGDGKRISLSYGAGKLWGEIVNRIGDGSDLSNRLSEIKLPLKKQYEILNIKRAINSLQVAVTSVNKKRIYYLNPMHISLDDFIARKISHKPPQNFFSRMGHDPHEKYHAGQPFSSDRKGNFSARRIPLFSSVVNNSRFHAKEASLKKAEGRNVRAAIDVAKGLDIGMAGVYSTVSGMISRVHLAKSRHLDDIGKPSIESWLYFLTSRGKKLSCVINDTLGNRKKLGLSDALLELSKKINGEDEIHLTSSDRVSGFFGIASGGMPFFPGWFAGILGGLSCSHRISLARTDEDNVKLTFTKALLRGVTGLIGTGQGLERTMLGSHGLDYMTVLPAEANLIMAAHFTDKKDFTFCLSNNDFIQLMKQFEKGAIDSELTKNIISESELCELEEKEFVIMLEAKSELRLEVGGMADANTYLVVPRTALGARLALNLLSARSISQLIIDKNNNITRSNKDNVAFIKPELDIFRETKIMPVSVHQGEMILCIPLPLTEEYQDIKQFRTQHGVVQWDKVVTKHLKLSGNINSGSEKDIKEFYSQKYNLSELNNIPFFITLIDGLSLRKGLTLMQVAKYEDVIHSMMKKINEIKDSLSQQERLSLGKSCVITLIAHYERIENYCVSNPRGFRLKKIEFRRLGTLSHETATVPLAIINFSSKNEISYDESLGCIILLYRHDADIIPFTVEMRLRLLY